MAAKLPMMASTTSNSTMPNPLRQTILVLCINEADDTKLTDQHSSHTTICGITCALQALNTGSVMRTPDRFRQLHGFDSLSLAAAFQVASANPAAATLRQPSNTAENPRQQQQNKRGRP